MNEKIKKGGWKQSAQSLRRNKRVLRSLGIGFAVILVPESYQVSTLEVDNDLGMIVSDVKEWPSEIVARIAQTEGIPVFDVAPALQQFRREHQTTALYFPNDPNHPNETGQRVIGEAVAQYLLGRPGICQVAVPP